MKLYVNLSYNPAQKFLGHLHKHKHETLTFKILFVLEKKS